MPELALNDLSYQDKLRSTAEFWAKAVGGEFVENDNWIKVVEASEGDHGLQGRVSSDTSPA